jgi:hypothetical protein
MAQFRGYCENIELQSANKLIAHKTDNGRVVVIEYEVQGTILATGVKYNNRFCSIIKLRKSENRALERLHGLSRRLERIDCARSLNGLINRALIVWPLTDGTADCKVLVRLNLDHRRAVVRSNVRLRFAHLAVLRRVWRKPQPSRQSPRIAAKDHEGDQPPDGAFTVGVGATSSAT